MNSWEVGLLRYDGFAENGVGGRLEAWQEIRSGKHADMDG